MKNRLLFTLILGLSLPPAFTQESGMQPLLYSDTTPPVIKLKDMGQDWMCVKIRMQGDPNAFKAEASNPLSALLGLSRMEGMSADESSALAALAFLPSIMNALGMITGEDSTPASVYYTKGQLISLGEDTFLIAYRHRQPEFDLIKVALESERKGQDPDFKLLAEQARLTEDSEMSLNLINVRSVATIKDVRPFELEREIAESANRFTVWDILAMGSEMHTSEEEGEKTATGDEADLELPISVFVNMVNSAIKADSKLSTKGNNIRAEAGAGRIILRGTVVNSNIKTRASHIARQNLKSFGSDLKVENRLVVKSVSKK